MSSRLKLLAIGALAATAGLTAQQPAPQPTFRTEANYVRVDVFPTKDGAPVLDLTQNDFEVLESGTPQRIEQFEHVTIRAAGPQDTRIEPNTVAEARSMAQSPRARVFVIFLDNYHVDVAASHHIRKPLIEALDRVIGPDDLVGVMTPEMSAADIAFARKTTTIEGFLTRYWYWGDRDRMIPPDPEDVEYGICYPNAVKTPNGPDCTDQNGIAAEMIDRRHEKRAIDALHDLVRFLGGVREERKAILTITNGWLLYRPNQNLMRPLNCHGIPTGPTIGVEPRGGKLTTKEPSTTYAPRRQCDVDRINLAQIDDERDFRQLLDEANRVNASFYPVDPRGLAVFDTPIMRTDVPGPPPPMVPPTVDHAMLRGRLESLRTLAEATDGLAIVDSNDLAGGLKRAVADLSSYYLLGYYSTGRLDGKFHSITVRVKRPGVQVRARRGYLAATPGAVTTAARAAAAPTAPDAETLAIQMALAPLVETQRELPLRVHAAAGWRPGASGAPAAAFWVVGEFGAGGAPSRDVDVSVVGPSGATVARGTGGGGARSVLVALTPTDAAAAGDYTIRVRSEGSGTGSVRVTLPPAPDAGGAIFFRRGQVTGNREVPTADLRFRRNERLRVEVPAPAAEAPAARLLDRTGKPLAIPVTAAVRDDADGARWHSGQLALGPLAPGDYVIEMSGRSGGSGGSGEEQKRTFVAFRIVQ